MAILYCLVVTIISVAVVINKVFVTEDLLLMKNVDVWMDKLVDFWYLKFV